MKQYYFLVGLPRSGNTLLASLLNQNPKITVTPNSLVADILWYLKCQKEQSPTFKNFPNEQCHDDLMKSIFDSYYKSYKSEIIIDRSNWGTKNNLNLLKRYCPNEPKFILLVRNVLEVLASFIKWSQNNKPNFLDKEVGEASVELKCDFLMRPDLQIVQEYIGIYELYKNANTCLIDYQDLTSNPELVVDRLYAFLGEPVFEHSYTNLKPLEINGIIYDDLVFGKNLHKVKKNIEASSLDIHEYLPRSVIEKYGDLNFWDQDQKKLV